MNKLTRKINKPLVVIIALCSMYCLSHVNYNTFQDSAFHSVGISSQFQTLTEAVTSCVSSVLNTIAQTYDELELIFNSNF